MLTKRQFKKKVQEKPRHGFNDDIAIFFELEFNGDLMVPGTKFKIKNDRGVYLFQCFAHNIKLDVSWVDCMSVDTGEFRSFRVSKIKSIVKTKISRAKKK